MNAPARPSVPSGAALYVALVQFLFVTTWTTYVIFLPQLLATASLPAHYAPWILLIDQLVFMGTDVYTGVAADHAQRTLGRVGPMIVGWTLVSCLAFLLLPHAALLGGAAPAASLALIGVWAVTSSALRAPPWVLLGKHAARPALPWLNSLTLIGLAAGGAIAPYLGVTLKNLDPRWPFALSSLTLLAATAGIVVVERSLARQPSTATPAAPAAAGRPLVLRTEHAAYLLGILLLAAGFQAHFSLNAAAQFLRFAKPAELEWLMPLFWVGFGAAIVPGSELCKRFGTLWVIAVSAWVGAVGAYAAARASSLVALIGAQLVTGCAWGIVLMAVFCSAAERGRVGREGLVLGTMFAMLALATLCRIGAVLSGVNKQPEYANLLPLMPVVCWVLGGIVIGMLAARPRPSSA
jgi:hypothetical protein